MDDRGEGGQDHDVLWGDEPTFPAGANLLGPEPVLAGDVTAPSRPSESSPQTFQLNPFGLAHTFGNVAEWATDPAGGFVRMGGHFRTEPAAPLPVVKVEKAEELGPDPFVGVRPAFVLTPESGSALIRQKLATDPALGAVVVHFDPDTATATLTGSVADATARRSADRILDPVWFVASVDNKLTTSTLSPNQLVVLGPVAGASRKYAILDRSFVEIPLAVHWLDPLPVAGTSWWINIYLPGSGHLASKLDPGEPGRASKLMVTIDRSRLARLGLADDTPVKVALSIGSALADPGDSRVVSNLIEVRPTFPARSR